MDNENRLYVAQKPQPEFKLDLESLGLVLDEECDVTPAQRDVLLAEHDFTNVMFDAGTRYMLPGKRGRGPVELDLTDANEAQLFVGEVFDAADFSPEAVQWVTRVLMDVAECAEAEHGIRLIKAAPLKELLECMRILAFSVDRLPEDER